MYFSSEPSACGDLHGITALIDVASGFKIIRSIAFSINFFGLIGDVTSVNYKIINNII